MFYRHTLSVGRFDLRTFLFDDVYRTTVDKKGGGGVANGLRIVAFGALISR
jgi:hypothetical protein